MEAFAAYLRLTFKAGEIELVVFNVVFPLAEHEQPFDHLGEQILMVERYVSTPIFQRKNDPGSQTKKFIGVKKLLNGNPALY